MEASLEQRPMDEFVDNFANKEEGEPRQDTRKASAIGKKVKARKHKAMKIDTTTTLDS